MLTFVSWNVDGLNNHALNTRFLAVLNTIEKIKPEIIFFQEIVDAHVPKLHEALGNSYTIISGKHSYIVNHIPYSEPYFVVTLVSKKIEIVKHENIHYSNTTMGRSMLVVEGQYGDLIIKMINTHLESLRNSASKRKVQFKECIEKLNQFGNEPGVFAIFGGDLNIRDKELCTLPSEIQDAWVAAGQLKEHEYTWDMIRNEPKDVIMRNARCRFDRIYFTGIYKNVEFWLDGTERDDVAKCFPSDHFAVCCRFFSLT